MFVVLYPFLLEAVVDGFLPSLARSCNKSRRIREGGEEKTVGGLEIQFSAERKLNEDFFQKETMIRSVSRKSNVSDSPPKRENKKGPQTENLNRVASSWTREKHFGV